MDQSKFDSTLQTYLQRLKEEKIPAALNKKAFFVTLGAYGATEMVNPHKIFWELYRPITAKRQDGSSGEVPIGFVIAAKRAHAHWASRVGYLMFRNRAPSYSREWQKLVTKKFTGMVGGRQRAAGFIRVGWLGVIQELGPLVARKDGRSISGPKPRMRGGMKGKATPATPGTFRVTIENSAQAKSDKRNGLITHGAPPLQRAFDRETADMATYLEREALKEETDKFNAAQH